MATEIRGTGWDVKDLTTGWSMTEECARFGARRPFFSQENRPPLDSNAEADHHWRDFEGTRAVRYDLMCRSTWMTLKLDNFLDSAIPIPFRLRLLFSKEENCPLHRGSPESVIDYLLTAFSE